MVSSSACASDTPTTGWMPPAVCNGWAAPFMPACRTLSASGIPAVLPAIGVPPSQSGQSTPSVAAIRSADTTVFSPPVWRAGTGNQALHPDLNRFRMSDCGLKTSFTHRDAVTQNAHGGLSRELFQHGCGAVPYLSPHPTHTAFPSKDRCTWPICKQASFVCINFNPTKAVRNHNPTICNDLRKHRPTSSGCDAK